VDSSVKGLFFETSSFTAVVPHYLSENEYRQVQLALLLNPEHGDLMPGTGGFRKLRWADMRRGKGKRGGLRIIYYWLQEDAQFWMFAIYDKDEMTDLTKMQERQLKQAIGAELRMRRVK
jgi:hypothetical protein